MYLFSKSEVYLKYTLQKNHGPFWGFICLSGPLDGYSSIVCRRQSHCEDLLLNICTYVQTQKYTGSRFSKLMYFFSILEVYLKQTFNIDVFILKLRSILEVYYVNLCIYHQTLKYTWSSLSKFINVCATQQYIWITFPKSIITFQTQKHTWSILQFT